MYVSVPFCRAKCSFCNFASGVGNDAAVAAYVEKLTAEIRSARADAERMGVVLPDAVDTVYFGGGTPSLLLPEQMRAIFAALRESFSLASGAEMTLEAAPGQIDDALLESVMRDGVQRVSLGVQSFVDRESSAVGRTHTAAECFAEFEHLRNAGIANVGVDLIAGLPHQTAASWRQTLDALAASRVQHASVYMLEIDEDSRLGQEVLRGGERFHAPHVTSDELATELYEQACEALPAMGYTQYEISNFAQAGFESRHNRKYWQRAPYFGFGLDAHSMLLRGDGAALRFANTDELASYGFGSRTRPEIVDEDAAFEESIFLGLRLREGVNVAALREAFGARADALRLAVQEMCEAGWMVERDGCWTLTLQGRVISNEVFGRLLEPVEV